MTNIAMEAMVHRKFDGLPNLKIVDLSMAMLNNQMVYTCMYVYIYNICTTTKHLSSPLAVSAFPGRQAEGWFQEADGGGAPGISWDGEITTNPMTDPWCCYIW